MESDFLKKLKQSLETGVPNEAIRAGFDEIVSKSEKIESDPEAIKALKDKEMKLHESQKPLTKDEIELLKVGSTVNDLGFLTSESGRAEEEKMAKFEEMMFDKGKIKILKDDIYAYKKAVSKKEELLAKYLDQFKVTYGEESLLKMLADFRELYGETD